MIIDAHSHLADPKLCERLNLNLPANMLSTDALLAEQARSGVDKSVVSGARVMEAGLRAGLGAAYLMQTFNEYMAQVVSKNSGSIAGLGIAYPFGGDLVLAEVERSVTSLGLRGFIVVPRYDNEFLDSPRALEFFALCEKLGAVVFVHSADGCLSSEHLGEHRLVELVGRPNEMTICAARLLMAGHMERFPQLKIFFARLGGAITLYAGRIDNGWQTRQSRSDGVPPWGTDTLKESFLHSLRRIHVDTQTFHSPAIRCAVDTLGHERVLLGSDFPPVPRSVSASISDVRDCGIPPEAVTAVLGTNAERLFGLR